MRREDAFTRLAATLFADAIAEALALGIPEADWDLPEMWASRAFERAAKLARVPDDRKEAP